jgi:hypothetical protein
MKYRTEIDLNKMSERGSLMYLKQLLEDLSDCVHDLTSDRVRYDYTTTLIEHAEQAAKDLAVVIEKKRLTEEA